MDRTFTQTLGNTADEAHENYGGYIYLDTRFSTFDIDHKLTLGYSSNLYKYFVSSDCCIRQSGIVVPPFLTARMSRGLCCL